MDTTRATLLERIRDREDAAAWRQFDSIYRPMLMQFALGKGLDHAQAEDVTQHCMSAIHKHIDGFDYDPKKGRFKGWLRTLVNNRIRDMHRGRKEQPAASAVFKATPDSAEPPEELFDRVWREEHLKQCIRLVRSKVKESTFQAFQSYVIDEQPAEQVAEALGMTVNQVHAIKMRMTKMIRQAIGELTHDSG